MRNDFRLACLLSTATSAVARSSRQSYVEIRCLTIVSGYQQSGLSEPGQEMRGDKKQEILRSPIALEKGLRDNARLRLFALPPQSEPGHWHQSRQCNIPMFGAVFE